jgi:hypothetical protein
VRRLGTKQGKKKSCHFSWLLFFLPCEVPVQRRKEAFSADDRLEQPSEAKRTTEERPLYSSAVWISSSVFKPKFLKKYGIY